MDEMEFVTPEYISASDIKQLRRRLNLTQKEFAKLINSGKSTIERWERSEDRITGPVVLLVKLLENNPMLIERVKVPTKDYPLRLWYMHNNMVCTIIDVDERAKLIRIKNYVDNVMFRAFGSVDTPDYIMYKEFLESRCFPANRDKMKLVLKDLDIPFYDPFMIIEKTEGRMAEDDFWIRIER